MRLRRIQHWPEANAYSMAGTAMLLEHLEQQAGECGDRGLLADVFEA